VIQPTHRSVRWDSPMEDWQDRIDPTFAMQKIDSLTTLLTRLRSNGKHPAIGMVMGGGKLFWLKPKHTSSVTMPVVQLHERI